MDREKTAMNSKMMNEFWQLWRVRKKSQISYSDISIGVRFLSSIEAAKLCDRIPDEKWERVWDGGASRYWHQEGDLVFTKSRGRAYGEKSPVSIMDVPVSIIEFPLEIVEKTVVFGCAPD